MPSYHWSGTYTKTGAYGSGTIEASDQNNAVIQCERLGIVPYVLKPRRTMLQTIKSYRFGNARASDKERAEVYRAMAGAAATDQPFIIMLTDAQVGLNKRSNMYAALQRMLARITSERDPTVLLKSEADVVGPDMAAVWEAASQTPRPEEALNAMADITTQNAEMKATIKGATYKPMFYLLLLVVIGALMALVMAPTVKSIYAQFDAELPPLTRVVLGFTDFIIANILFIGAGAAVAVYVLTYLLKRPHIKLSASRFIQQLPLIGKVSRLQATQRLCALMGVMLNADIPQREALKSAANAMTSTAAKHQINKAAEQHRHSSFPDVIRNNLTPIDPKIERLAAQSESGAQYPGEGWIRYGNQKFKELERKVDSVVKMIDPISMAVVGTLIGVCVVAFYLPMFGISEIVNESVNSGG